MFDFAKVEAVAERIAGLLPADPRIVRDEFKNGVKPLIESMLARMDLVTRDEYDAQARVLQRTRAKLEELEQQLSALERGA